jgi:alcohol dehydrogenase class IV
MNGVYEFLAQDRVIFGVPSAQAVLQTVEHYRANRVYLVTSKTLNRKTDEIDKIRQALGVRYLETFDECIEHTPRASVLELTRRLRATQPDLVVTIGGGTPVDTVKLALLCLAENVDDEQTLGTFRIQVNAAGQRHIPQVGKPPVRQVVIPTTLSAAEFTNLGGCTDPVRQVKDLYTGREIGAMVVILDPAITRHTPQWLWLATGVRALDHAVETLCSKDHQPFTDATCLHGLTLLSRGLQQVCQDPLNMDARLDCQLGVWLSATGIMRVPMGASHGIGHQLGAVAGVPHGHTSCVLLPAVMRYNLAVNGDRQALIAKALGSPDTPAHELIGAIIKSLGMPTTLQQVGVKRDQFEAIADGALQNMWVRTNPRPIDSKDQVFEILESCW